MTAPIVMKPGLGEPQPTIADLVPALDTSTWYRTEWGCLKDDPTRVARYHSFPDAPIPRGVPLDPAAPAFICLRYRTAWPQGGAPASAAAMVATEAEHPQFAFRAGGPGTPTQIDMESQLRRLDQPLGRCQAVIAEDAPLYRNTVAPPVPPPGAVPVGVQNACNPVAAIVGAAGEGCRVAADQVATAMSGRWINNPTRQDTMRFDRPFAPPGVGTGAARPPVP
ncbi:hypothetical protein EBZ80_21905 [bacterium]|nr:hypothetical protein [bacterium]